MIIKNIEDTSNKIIALRNITKWKKKQEKKDILDSYKYNFVKDFLNSDSETTIKKVSKDLNDYWDNILRYFRLTKYLHIRWNGYFIDLEIRREKEILQLLNTFDWSVKIFTNKNEYFTYLSDLKLPELPWDKKENILDVIESNYIYIINTLGIDIPLDLLNKYNVKNTLNLNDLRWLLDNLKFFRQQTEEDRIYIESQKADKLEEYIENLENIYDSDNRPLDLEKYVSLWLKALNDAEQIKPNFPVWDDNEPTFTAPANTPDIEWFYKNYNIICEVTMLKSRDQWVNEWQPVMRHLRDFEDKYSNKNTYALFIAPTLHVDTVETFLNSMTWRWYRWRKQKIVPMTISNFISVLKILLLIRNKWKSFSHNDLENLYENIINDSESFIDSTEWVSKIPNIIENWKSELIK